MKKQLRELLLRPDFEQLVDLAGRRRRALSSLVSLTYDSDPLIGWRAVEGLGVAANHIAGDNPDFVRDQLRRLHWLLSEESGGVCWRAPEAMAEIIRYRPRLFADFIPIVVSLLREMAEEDLTGFRAGILWAIGRLGALAEESLDAVLSTIEACLDRPEPQVRGMAVWCLGQLGRTQCLTRRPDLLADEGPVDHYENAVLNRTSVSALLQRALSDERGEG